MSGTKPAIVIVPGAWHVPEHYEPFAKALRATGYETISVRHPSVSVSRDSGNMLRKDSTVGCDVMRKLVNDEQKDVVLVMHSYGGVAGSDAVAMLNEWLEVYGQPDHGKVVRLVYLAAHVLPKGEPFQGGGTGRAMPGLVVGERGMTTHATPYDRYYSETTREDAEAALQLLQPMAHSAFTSPTAHAGWRDYGIPATYIKCLRDKAVTPEMCDGYIARLQEAGVDARIEEMDAGHSPFWIEPERLAEVVLRSIG